MNRSCSSAAPNNRAKDDSDKNTCGQGPDAWLQLGFPDAEEHFPKAELVLRLDKAINSLGLSMSFHRIRVLIATG
jgi:hypothetical protein